MYFICLVHINAVDIKFVSFCNVFCSKSVKDTYFIVLDEHELFVFRLICTLFSSVEYTEGETPDPGSQAIRAIELCKEAPGI